MRERERERERKRERERERESTASGPCIMAEVTSVAIGDGVVFKLQGSLAVALIAHELSFVAFLFVFSFCYLLVCTYFRHFILFCTIRLVCIVIADHLSSVPPNERREGCIYPHHFIFIIYLFCTLRFVCIVTAQRAVRRLSLF